MLSWIKPLLQKEDLRSNTQNSEKEEDGFLVVGQTKSERTTVVTSEFHSDKDGPPTYMDVSIVFQRFQMFINSVIIVGTCNT